MHELSIACDLVDLAERAALDAHAERVISVRLRLGVLAGVEKDALLLGYESAIRGTLLEGSRLDIEDVPLIARCSTCREDRVIPSIQSLECPICGSPVTELVQGRELELASMEIAEHENATA